MSIVALSDWYPAMYAQWVEVRDPVPREDRESYIHHHTAGGANSSPLSYARDVADMHWAKWGVPGGYGVLIGTDAVAREMSGIDFEGVHSGTHYWNYHGIGIAYQGDFSNSPPADAMLDTAREVIASFPLDQSYHRAVRPTFTECPGDALIALLPLEVDMPLTDEDIRRIWDHKEKQYGDFFGQPDQRAGTLLAQAHANAWESVQQSAVLKTLLKADVSDADLDAAVAQLIEVIPDRTRAAIKAAL